MLSACTLKQVPAEETSCSNTYFPPADDSKPHLFNLLGAASLALGAKGPATPETIKMPSTENRAAFLFMAAVPDRRPLTFCRPPFSALCSFRPTRAARKKTRRLTLVYHR